MKQLVFTQQNQQLGKLKVVLRIIGRLIYFKFNNNQYSQQVISQIKNKGAKVTHGNGWVEINIFEGKEFVKLDGKEFNVNETSDEEFEVILSNFYKFQYAKAGFTLEEER